MQVSRFDQRVCDSLEGWQRHCDQPGGPRRTQLSVCHSGKSFDTGWNWGPLRLVQHSFVTGGTRPQCVVPDTCCALVGVGLPGLLLRRGAAAQSFQSYALHVLQPQVTFTITPTLPDGLDISAQNGELPAVLLSTSLLPDITKPRPGHKVRACPVTASSGSRLRHQGTGTMRVTKQVLGDVVPGPKQVRRPQGHEHNVTAGCRGQAVWVFSCMGYERSEELRGLARSL